jgi:hypothetical protein
MRVRIPVEPHERPHFNDNYFYRPGSGGGRESAVVGEADSPFTMMAALPYYSMINEPLRPDL